MSATPIDSKPEHITSKVIMDGDHFNEYITKKSLAVAVLIALVVWIALAYLLTPFVPTESVLLAYLGSTFAATPIVGVVFFAANMFWLVAKEDRKAKKSA